MLQARLAIELYRQFQNYIPQRLRMRLKHYIDEPRDQWQQIGFLEAPLNDTPFRLVLDMKHWHQRWTYIKGHYPEPHITRILEDYLQAGSLFIDIGANIGVHTVYAAHKVGESGKVIAFEPNPHSYKRLSDQLALNHLQNVTAHHTALGSEFGIVTLHGCNDENVGSSMRSTGVNDDDCEVPVNPADNFLKHIPHQQSGVCKIDVEGFEYQVLLGLREFIETHPNIVYVVEITDEWLQITDSSSQKVFDFFKTFDFEPYLINPHNVVLEALSQPLVEWQYDTLFSRQLITK